MMKRRFILLVILVLWFKLAQGDLNSFVTEKLEEFPAWLNGLDPFPFTLISEGFAATSNRLQLSGVLGNVTFTNLSTSPNMVFSRGSLEDRYFAVEYTFNRNFSASGEHQTTFSTVTIDDRVDGKWTASFAKWKGISDEYIHRLYFDILPSGHLQMVNIDTDVGRGYWYPSEVYFDGLSNHEALNGYKKELTAILRSELAYAWGDLDGQLATTVFGRFWIEIFSEVTAQDIIDHQPPPAKSGIPNKSLEQ